MKKILKFLQKQSAPRIIALGFAALILIGSLLLILPFSVKEGVELKYSDALYTSTSAVCVTGLVTVDIADTFTPIGQTIVALLIQIGGLGVATIGAGIIIAMGKKVDLKGRTLIREASNLSSGKGIVSFVKNVFVTTVIIELAGAILSFPVFLKDFSPLKAVGVSLFHSIAAFNNSGFDILGSFRSLTAYRDNIYLNLVTCILIFFGGIGFLVIREMKDKLVHKIKFSMHSKVVLSVSGALIVIGTLLIKLTEKVSWLGAFFCSVSARTAGFSTYSLGSFGTAGLLILMLFMFIGASPGSTGGGIKTSTFFVLLKGIKSAATNTAEKAFKYAIPKDTFKKAAVIALFGLGVVLCSTYVLTVLEPQLSLSDALFEMTSAFGTVGLTTGITTSLSMGSKLLTILVMYIGRLGPMTVATLWSFSKGERIGYAEGNIAIG